MKKKDGAKKNEGLQFTDRRKSKRKFTRGKEKRKKKKKKRGKKKKRPKRQGKKNPPRRKEPHELKEGRREGDNAARVIQQNLSKKKGGNRFAGGDISTFQGEKAL